MRPSERNNLQRIAARHAADRRAHPRHYHLSHYAVADFALAGLHTGQQDDAADVLDGLMAHADAMTPGGAHLSRRLRLLHDLARALIADPADARHSTSQALSPGAERWPFDQACAQLHFGEHLAARRPPHRRSTAAARGRPRDLSRNSVRPPGRSAPRTELRATGAAPGPHPRQLPVTPRFRGVRRAYPTAAGRRRACRRRA